MEKIVHDKELGEILLKTSARAIHYSLKIGKGKITAVMPVGGDEARLLAFIQRSRERLRKALEKHPARPLLTEESTWQTTTFRLHIFRTERTNFYMRLENGVLHIACPKEIEFADNQVQDILNRMLTQALRHEAKRLLPPRLQHLAALHHFQYTGVKIHNSKSNWGSCTKRKSINLSLSLMLLPCHLIDYVLLHELCHTIEMNHGERFHVLMDKVTNGKARALEKELKGYHTL